MRKLFILLLFTATSVAAQNIAVTQIASGLDQPIGIAHAGDSRLFIVLQRGRIAIHDGTRILPTPFLDVTSLVSCCGERGLLGLAFHPRYAENGYFFINYTDRNGNTAVVRYQVSSNRDVADPNSARLILAVAQPFANHNGGHLAFGPDGYLYIGLGDGGSAGDPGNRAQDFGTLLGKMLRIDIDSGSPYAVPASNPYVSQPGVRPEIWAIGLRNPWRYSFDRLTGDLWIADVGQNIWEEVNFAAASSPGGENYGWRRMEGAHCFNPSTNCNNGSLVLPVFEYDHNFGCSVTGGYRYRGSRYPFLKGVYLFGDYCTGNIWGTTRLANGTWSTRLLLRVSALLSSFGEDMNGELYFTDARGGAVFAISETTPPPPARRRAAGK